MIKHLSRMTSDLADLGVPLFGVSGKQGSVLVDFRPEATAQNQANAAAFIAAFDWSEAAHAQWLAAKEQDLNTLRDQATQAVADINTFLAIASPTNAQVLAEVKAIDQRQRAIIKALARLAIKTLG